MQKYRTAFMAGLISFSHAATAGSDESARFIQDAGAMYGAEGARVAEFLMANAPAWDKGGLPEELFIEDVRLALDARGRFPWSKDVPEDIFLNDVAPYAALDEKRDEWRQRMLEAATPLVKDCHTASDAAQALNRDLFKKLGVRYSTDRERANQSPAESIASGKATCTGLSILLVDACRAVGIPARIAGLEHWNDKPGNHTWVEVWDHGWHFTGAAEYTPEGLDHSWFSDDIAHGHGVQTIHAASWKKTVDHFPLVWNEGDASVPAIVVTGNYRQPAGNDGRATLQVSLYDKPGGTRIEAPVEWVSASGMVLASGTTKAGTADLNDMAGLSAAPTAGGFLRARRGGDWRDWPVDISGSDEKILRLSWSEGDHSSSRAVPLVQQWLARPAASRGPAPDLSLSGTEATQILNLLWTDRKAAVAEEEGAEMDGKQIVFGDKKMPWLERTFGAAPAGGRSLWISMHGGGGAPPELNDSQWHNQILLYEPQEGIVVAPRAPTNTWNLWHENHIDPMFDRLIAGMVSTRGVDPNKVYLMGYSAGGDGVYQLAPRMADRFAAASMMAGHPNDARPEPLQDLPFFIFVGGADDAYGRNKVAAEWGARLDALAAADPGGYIHKTTIYPGLPHWMNRRDAEVLPWMAAYTRDPWPKKVVWIQGNAVHDRFYWLKVPAGTAKKGDTIRASVQGQTITLESPDTHRATLRLSDALLELDKPVTVMAGGKTVYSGLVTRSAPSLLQSLQERADPDSAASAQIEVAW
jgi:hypothetical protein